MRDVFDRVYRNRPTTFTTFGPSGLIESGTSPMSYTTTVTRASGHLLPGGLSWYGKGNGGITYSGRFSINPDEGGQGSVEIIRESEDFTVSGTVSLIEIPNFFTLTRSRTVEGSFRKSEYILTVYGTDRYTFETNAAPNLEHIALNLEGNTITVFVNGESFSASFPTGGFTGSDNLRVSPAGGKLWGVMIRLIPVTAEYCQEMTELVHNFPLPEEAESQFNTVAFRLDRNLVEYEHTVTLDDLLFEPALDSIMVNGAKLPDQEISYAVGTIEANDNTNVNSVMIDYETITPVVVGDMSLGAEDYEVYATIPSPVRGVIDISPVDKVSNGDPAQVYIEFPLGDANLSDKVMMANLTFLSDVDIPSCSIASRTITLTHGSFIAPQQVGILNGGFTGTATAATDPYETASETPYGYGGWFYLSASTSGQLFSKGAVTLSFDNATKKVTGAGGTVYVNGASYAGAVLDAGWHHLAIVATTRPTSSGFTVNGAGGLVYSMSEFDSPNPASYISDLYNAYVDPESATPTTADVFAITETGGRIYSHDWSISSAD